VSTVFFTALVLAVAIQRLWEVRRSARHEAQILELGGREHAAGQMAWMRAIHALWLGGMLAEAWLVRRTAPAWLVAVAAVAFLLGQTLRLSAMRALGPRWTVKVMTVPEPAVSSGIFRVLRHPNYVGVCLELAALPLLGGAYVTAVVASIANAVLLRLRIGAEEAALREDSSYDAVFGTAS
jgi:methyltransferase